VTQHCSDERLTISLSSAADDGFDLLIATLEKNPAAISFSEKTGPQTTLDPKENPLIADAERRAKAAE
jgi:hypothetical protein